MSKDLSVTMLGGNCPVQAEGTVDDHLFYFRARGEHWALHVAPDPLSAAFAPGAWVHRETYEPPDGGERRFAAGWMTDDEARTFIEKAVALWRGFSR